jgi:predicted DNA-binding transcriptional regulator YafY
MSRVGQSITLSVNEKEKQALEALARDLGLLWGDKPNISKLIKAIANNRLKIAVNHDWSQNKIHSLKQAIDVLNDQGLSEIALELAKILLERSELSDPLRREIEKIVENPPPPWRQTLDKYIQQEQPIQLSYQDARGELSEFHLYHAAINRHEERFYLDCWCEETEGNQDIPELQHNWNFRLDRIPPDALISPIKGGKWHSKLDAIAIEIHLFGGLARSYQTKTNIDTVNELLQTDPPIRQIIRQVTNTFWFYREVLRYGEDCLIVSPESIRKRFHDKLQRMVSVQGGS